MTVLEPVINYILNCKRKKVTLCQVMAGADRPRRPVLRVLDRLVKEGYLEETADDKIRPGYGEHGCNRRNPSWRVINPPVIPVMRPKRRTNRDKIWKAVRMRRRFTQAEVRTIAGVRKNTVCEYVRSLVKHGYVHIIGKDGHANVYLLRKDVGPVRPLLKEGR